MKARTLLAACCAGGLLALGSGSAISGDEDYDTGEAFYGAIAYSPSSRAHGWAYDYPSRGAAERRALAQCSRNADDCVVPVWFRNACGALAVGYDGYGSGWGASRNLAQNYAIQSCSRYSAGCTIVRWVCTSKPD
jgi:serine/threonine-protein kinase